MPVLGAEMEGGGLDGLSQVILGRCLPEMQRHALAGADRVAMHDVDQLEVGRGPGHRGAQGPIQLPALDHEVAPATWFQRSGG